jgi:hypothetical protein
MANELHQSACKQLHLSNSTQRTILLVKTHLMLFLTQVSSEH